MLNIPVLRWGQPYESLETDEVKHFLTGETIAKVGQANGGLLQRDMRHAPRARQVLRDIAPAELTQRIKKAALEVCQIPVGTHQIRIEQELKACREDAVDRAIAQANLPTLTALHQSKTGRKVDSPQYADRR